MMSGNFGEEANESHALELSTTRGILFLLSLNTNTLHDWREDEEGG